MTKITHPTGSTEPRLWMNYAASSTTTTLVHSTMTGETIVVYGPSTPRKSQLALLYSDEAEARAAEALHVKPGIFTITEEGVSTVTMRYVVVGEVTRELEPDTAENWIVYVDAQEVTA